MVEYYTNLMQVLNNLAGIKCTIVSILLLAFLTWFLIRRHHKLNHSMPPGPWLFLPGSRPHESITRLGMKYGGIMSLRLGPKKVIVVNDEECFYEAFSKQGEHFTNRNVPPLMKEYAPITGSFTFDEGPTWHQLRTFGVSAFRKFGVGKKELEHRLHEEGLTLCKYFNQQEGNAFDASCITATAIANIMNVMMFSKRFEYTDPRFRNLMLNLRGAAQAIKVTDPVNYIPFLYRTPLYKRHRDYVANLKQFIVEEIDEHRLTFDPSNIRDIVDMYLNEVSKEDNGMLPHDEMLVWRGVYDLFGGATESTNTALQWTILFLAYNTDIQTKVQAQIDSVIGRERLPTLKDRPSLAWVQATITESLRLRPPGPFTQRGATQEVSVGGYTIPKGTTVVGNIWAVQHDPKKFNNPEQFDPSRFLNANSEFVPNPAVVAFGVGRRVCLGKQLAETELFIFLTMLLQRFTFRFPSDQLRPDMEGVIGFALNPEPFKICAMRRY